MSNKENLITLVETWEEPNFSSYLQPESSPQKSPSLPFVTPKPRYHPKLNISNDAASNSQMNVNASKTLFSPMTSISHNINNMTVNSPKPARLAQLAKETNKLGSPKKNSPSKFSPVNSPSKFASHSPLKQQQHSPSKLKGAADVLVVPQLSFPTTPSSPTRRNPPRSPQARSPSKLSSLASSPSGPRSPMRSLSPNSMRSPNATQIGYLSPTLSPLAWTSTMHSPKFVHESDHPLAISKKDELLDDASIARQRMWEAIIDDWEDWTSTANKAKFRSLVVLQGIYPSLRKVVWKKLAKTEALKESHARKGLSYADLLAKGPSSSERQINLDTPRTFQCHDYFRTEKAQSILFNILNAYAHLNPDVGYCQGMSFLCGALLMVISDEEDVFWTFVFMMQHLHSYFLPTMEGLIRDNKNLSALLNSYMPELAAHFEEMSVETLFFSSRWLLSMFTDWPNWETVLRSWDIFFAQGRKGLLRVCLAMLKICQGDLMNECESMEDILLYIFKIPIERFEPIVFGQVVHSIDIDLIITKLKSKLKERPVPSTPVLMKESAMNLYNAASSFVNTIMTPRPSNINTKRVAASVREDEPPKKMQKRDSNMMVPTSYTEQMFQMFSTPTKEEKINDRVSTKKKIPKDIQELTTFSTKQNDSSTNDVAKKRLIF